MIRYLGQIGLPVPPPVSPVLKFELTAGLVTTKPTYLRRDPAMPATASTPTGLHGALAQRPVPVAINNVSELTLVVTPISEASDTSLPTHNHVDSKASGPCGPITLNAHQLVQMAQ